MRRFKMIEAFNKIRLQNYILESGFVYIRLNATNERSGRPSPTSAPINPPGWSWLSDEDSFDTGRVFRRAAGMTSLGRGSTSLRCLRDLLFNSISGPDYAEPDLRGPREI